MKLYGYWRSSAAYRVRIALNLKEIHCEHESVHLVKDGGEQHQPHYQELNVMELVPTLVDGDIKLNQSLAILEYLEKQYPETALLPEDVAQQMQVRAFALDIACDIHPVNNLRVLQQLAQMGHDEEQKQQWYLHWLAVGFAGIEQKLAQTAGYFCFDDTITWADICLIPQVYNALRFKLDMTKYPNIMTVYENCMALDEFKQASPEQQADAVVSS